MRCLSVIKRVSSVAVAPGVAIIALLAPPGCGERADVPLDPATLPGRLTIHEQAHVVADAGFVRLGFVPGGAAFWTVDDHTGEVVIHDLATGATRAAFNRHDQMEDAVHGSPSVDFSADGRRCVTRTVCARSVRLAVWDVATGACIHSDPVDPIPVISFALSPNGDRLLAGGCDGSVTLAALDRPANLVVVAAGPDEVDGDGSTQEQQVEAAFDADGTRFVTIWKAYVANHGWVGHVATWDAATGRRLHAGFADGDRIRAGHRAGDLIEGAVEATRPWILGFHGQGYLDLDAFTVVATIPGGWCHRLAAPDLLFVCRQDPGPGGGNGKFAYADYAGPMMDAPKPPVTRLCGLDFPSGRMVMAEPLPDGVVVAAIAPDGGMLLTRDRGEPGYSMSGRFTGMYAITGPIRVWRVDATRPATAP